MNSAPPIKQETFQPPLDAQLTTPILLICYNRPDLTVRALESIRKARPRTIYVAVDGPKSNKLGDVGLVTLVHEAVKQIDWDCTVKKLFRKKNLGCRLAVSSAIDWFFAHEERGIILEDDCIPCASFYWFCQEMLSTYENDPEIMVISGTNITQNIKYNADIFFSKYPLIWGWATWRRTWSQYDVEMAGWQDLRSSNWLRRLGLGGSPFIARWRSIFDRTAISKELDTWDFQLFFSVWLNEGLVVAPSKNLVENIGMRSDATHTKTTPFSIKIEKPSDLRWPLTLPLEKCPHRQSDKYISRHWFRATWPQLISTWLTENNPLTS